MTNLKDIELNVQSCAALKEYARAAAELRVALTYAANQRTNFDKLARYFNSTPLRFNFGVLMVVAAYDKAPIGVTRIAELLGVSRPAAHTYVKDTVPQGWVVKSQCEGADRYHASEELVSRWEGFIQQVHVPLIKKINSQEAYVQYLVSEEKQKLEDKSDDFYDRLLVSFQD